MAVVTPIKVKGRELKPHKAIVAPLLGAPTVLTIEPWTFVSLWLKREKEHDALFYWDQAFEFHKASMGLPLQSAPLVLYYSFLNAVKTLLVAKSVPFDEHHGVRRHKMGGATNRINIANEGVRILRRGVVPALSTYYGEA